MRRSVIAAAAAVVCSASMIVGVQPAATAAAPVTCSSSSAVPAKALLAHLTLSSSDPFSPVVGFQVAQHGTWAGIAFLGSRTSGPEFRVISYRRGHRVRVLLSVGLQQADWYPTLAVVAVGVTPAGAVIATVDKDESPSFFGYSPQRTYALTPGHRTVLKAPTSWWAVVARDVTADGRIIGYGLSGSYTHPAVHAVSWSSIHASPRAIPGVPGNAAISMVGDANGDIAWQNADAIGVVRLSNGQIRTLADPTAPTYLQPGYGVNPQVAAGRFVWSQGSFGTLLRWDLSTVPSSGPIEATVLPSHPGYASDSARAASANGSVIDMTMTASASYLNLVDGRDVRMHQDNVDDDILAAIDDHGVVAYTSPRDHLPHFLTCH